MDRDSWNRASRVDYRRNHLRPPPRGYEWRQVNGSFVLGAIATGVIADIVLNAR
jgi:Ni/Co efflux regulator RcnB